MMEVYLNVAEWGDGVFGAEAAAQKYFHKSAKNLTRREAALLARPCRTRSPQPGPPGPAIGALAGQLQARMEGAAPFSECLKP